MNSNKINGISNAKSHNEVWEMKLLIVLDFFPG